MRFRSSSVTGANVLVLLNVLRKLIPLTRLQLLLIIVLSTVVKVNSLLVLMISIKVSVEPAWKIMSKGIGDNYLERCGSYHLPKRRYYESSEDYIETLVDRCFYFDGEYKYPLPRYYRERLFQTKVRYPVIYYDKKRKKANVRFGQRYAITDISIKMSANVRDRIDKAYQERFDLVKALYKVDDSAAHFLPP